MSRDKQIEEITRVICQSNRGGICGYDRKPCHFDCGSYQLATKVYNAGYRKSTDVAEEIFAEIEKWLAKDGDIRLITAEKFVELKKKYTKSEDTK